MPRLELQRKAWVASLQAADVTWCQLHNDRQQAAAADIEYIENNFVSCMCVRAYVHSVSNEQSVNMAKDVNK